ncbi:Tm-1-like ATP-binding domain-containing protein [Dongia sedimenti]|uniref:Tm-1-like ATP-binding domain-containing protein n=1 Tax=Dongia sedimenti TaxID=3064282 RepID=A0ABU0YUK5_9PROT|nr:Tm-1-like ATP-binding domain-containing protein [Rhodospirillaceae bacterium R-7]
MRRIYVIGTCDTKGDELHFACACIARAGAQALLVDVSTATPDASADVTAETIAAHHPQGQGAVLGLTDRGQAVSAMGVALTHYLLSRKDIGAVLGLGGSGNTAIVTQAMRALPVGVPKVMVSTLASGNVAGFVGPTDIMMLHAVTDIAGLNAISRTVIGNAAHAAAGMVLTRLPKARKAKRSVGYTMFGVTTACVNEIRRRLEPGWESFVFHATGTGGQSFEKLAESGFFDGVLDITTTEVADYLVGGVLPCTADRFGAFIRRSIPYVGSVGACDMVNFGARDTVPAQFSSRQFHIHNAHVTLMRTTPEENAQIGAFIVERVNRMPGPVRFLLPLRGVSAIDAAGQPFHDPAADAALFDAIRKGWRRAKTHKLIELDLDINDPAFAAAAVKAFKEITS